MSQQELLKRVVQALDDAGIEYMVTGAVASSLQGEPRSTHDIDLVAAIEETKVTELIKAFPPPVFYLSEESIINAINNESMFNLIDVNTGDKVDFWLLTDDPFDQSRFSRKYVEEVMGMRIMVSSPEDTILVKLRWANLSGGSEKQLTDALRVYEVQFERLDMDYLRRWAKKIGVAPMLKRLKDKAEVI